jgi:hypothetical protein
MDQLEVGYEPLIFFFKYASCLFDLEFSFWFFRGIVNRLLNWGNPLANFNKGYPIPSAKCSKG